MPPRLAIFRESSSVAQALIWTRGDPSSGSSKSSPDQEFWTTCQPYPAEGVVWMMMAPTAPFFAAIRYL